MRAFLPQVARKAEPEGRAPPERRREANPLGRSLTYRVPPAAGRTRDAYFSGGGERLAPDLRGRLEGRVGADLGDVRLHRDEGAHQAAGQLGARAFTVGRDIAFARGAFQPETDPGERLLVHELAHTVQQRGAAASPSRPLAVSEPGDASEREADAVAEGWGGPPLHESAAAGVIQRAPAAPGSATYDRSSIDIGPVDDMLITKTGSTYSVPAASATVTVNDAAVTHIRWDLYDPSDARLSGAKTKPGAGNATSRPFAFGTGDFPTVSQGRHTLRCTGLNKDDNSEVYADRSFYVWTSAPASMQDLATLKKTQKSSTASLGQVGAAYARAMMLEHQESLDSGGSGTVQGNKCATAAPSGATQHDCTTYVLQILDQAFAAKGKSADWKKVMKAANKASGGALKGTEVLKALESEAGWKGVFWSPDPTNPDDKLSEHPSAYKKVKESGTYYGIDVEKAKSIIEYRRTSTTKREVWSNLDKLKSVPLGVIAAKGGTHMTLILNGVVYEVHWDLPASDPNVIEATPLERWAWNSGVILMPADDFAKAFP